MKEIQLTQGKVALVDDEDFERVNKYKWCAFYNSKWYSMRKEKGVTVLLHRFITNAPKGMDVDHINGNGLDNQKTNLRVCTHQQNMMNLGIKKNNTSGVPGVCFDKQTNTWKSQITINGKNINLGRYIQVKDAIKARKDAEYKMFGEFSPSR